jgi:hypothetical protein
LAAPEKNDRIKINAANRDFTESPPIPCYV